MIARLQYICRIFGVRSTLEEVFQKCFPAKISIGVYLFETEFSLRWELIELVNNLVTPDKMHSINLNKYIN